MFDVWPTRKRRVNNCYWWFKPQNVCMSGALPLAHSLVLSVTRPLHAFVSCK